VKKMSGLAQFWKIIPITAARWAQSC
jgi:hypothetical protein